ncbi:MAG: hypothetical protein SH868_06645 [Bythopirellula sp.]|nr:hypothetical protein [Bythopirellula sp.]
MDDPAPGAPSAEKRSHQTAEALRALRDGLGAKLETQRRRISDLETDLTARVLHIAEELAQEQAAESQAALALHEDHLRKLSESLAERDATIAKLERQLSDAELSHLRLSAELAESRSAIEAVRVAECQDCGKLRSELSAANDFALRSEAQLQTLQTQVAQLTQELAQSKQAAATLLAEQGHDESVLEEIQTAVEQTQKLLDETIAELEASEEREILAAARVENLLGQIDQLAEELAESQTVQEAWLSQQAADDAALAESNSAFAKSQSALTESQSALAAAQQLVSDQTAELAAAANRESQSASQIEALLTQVSQLSDELAQSRAAESRLLAQHSADDSALADTQLAAARENQSLREQLVEVAAARDLLAEQLTQVQAEITAREESFTNELSWLEKEFEAAEQGRKQLAHEFEELLKQHKTTEELLADANLQNDQAVALLQKAEAKIAELSDSTAHEAELDQARRKFELALADAQKLKRDNADLQAELAQRPEKSEAESPELFSLRVERDALATRVAELEAAPVQAVDQDAEQRMSDLQRRFELAVDDLRHLKQENATLQEKLASAPQGGHAAPSLGGAMDWQSQKARLLAALESEDADDAEEETPARRQERTTIEGTISITDRVVADKDREIAELRAELADRSFAVVEESATAETNMLDKDELIAAERAKLAELQKELHDKLRTAELEMSLQRAAIARKEAEFEHKLQAAQQAAADAPVGPDGKPRRKWLSALGLRDDDEK